MNKKISKKLKSFLGVLLFLGYFGNGSSALAQENLTQDQIEARSKIEKILSDPKKAKFINSLLSNPKTLKAANDLLDGKAVHYLDSKDGSLSSRMIQLFLNNSSKFLSYLDFDKDGMPHPRISGLPQFGETQNAPDNQEAPEVKGMKGYTSFREKALRENPLNPNVRTARGALLVEKLPPDEYHTQILATLQKPPYYDPKNPDSLNPYDPEYNKFNPKASDLQKEKWRKEKIADTKKLLKDWEDSKKSIEQANRKISEPTQSTNGPTKEPRTR